MCTRAPRLEDEAELGGPKFDPPLYKQRYNAVLDVARRQQARRIIDVGCSSCKLLRKLKREPYVEELVGTDIDAVELNMCKWLTQPLTTDFLFPRLRPLTIRLMQGSIATADDRLVNFDMVVCIEVIEHLDPPVLARVPEVIFGALHPKVVVVTTPNAEFNVLFPGFSGFRHPDHRFEWTRQEFQAWCDDICGKYQYTVEYSGVGDPPVSMAHLGHCSQMAVFLQREGVSFQETVLVTPYTVITECAHPYDKNPLTHEKKLCQEAEYYLGVLLKSWEEEEEEEEEEGIECGDGCGSVGGRQTSDLRREEGVEDRRQVGSEEAASNAVLIPLEDLLDFPRVRTLCSSVDDIRVAIQQHSETVKLNSMGTHAVYHRQDNELENWEDNELGNWDLSVHKWRVSHDSVPQGEDHCSLFEDEALEGQSTGINPEPECWD